MSASLGGSEMCIRDRFPPPPRTRPCDVCRRMNDSVSGTCLLAVKDDADLCVAVKSRTATAAGNSRGEAKGGGGGGRPPARWRATTGEGALPPTVGAGQFWQAAGLIEHATKVAAHACALLQGDFAL
eukprot:15149375-Alexandrium_andersonii.AAC.1